MIRVYSLVSSPNLFLADDDGQWFSFIGIADGWARRKPWNAAPAVIRRLRRPENRVTFFGCAWLAAHTFGLPADRVEALTADQLQALMAEAA